MEDRKTKISFFVDFIVKTFPVSTRLLKAFKIMDGEFYDYDIEKSFDDIRYIRPKSFLLMRDVGRKTWAEFNEIRTTYLKYAFFSKKDFEEIEIPRVKYISLIRSDISDTLKTVEDEINFVETAILEKFKKDGIKLVNNNINQENETV